VIFQLEPFDDIHLLLSVPAFGVIGDDVDIVLEPEVSLCPCPFVGWCGIGVLGFSMDDELDSGDGVLVGDIRSDGDFSQDEREREGKQLSIGNVEGVDGSCDDENGGRIVHSNESGVITDVSLRVSDGECRGPAS